MTLDLFSSLTLVLTCRALAVEAESTKSKAIFEIRPSVWGWTLPRCATFVSGDTGDDAVATSDGQMTPGGRGRQLVTFDSWTRSAFKTADHVS